MLSLSTPADLQSAFVADFLCNAGLPLLSVGRLPRYTFRGLIERLLALRPAFSRDHQVILSIEGSDDFVAFIAASIATGQATLPRRDFHPLEHTHIHGARTGPILTRWEVYDSLCASRVPQESPLAEWCFMF